MEVLVIDYGMGNLRSVSKALEHVGFKRVIVSSNPELVKEAKALVLPGVGAFRDAMRNLRSLSLLEPLLEYIDSGRPFLGICLGLQLLFEKSYEFGETTGLGVFEGEVSLLPASVKIPHIGWNQVWVKKKGGLFKGIEEGSFFYFVHSYRVVPKREEVIASTTDYGEYFVSSVEKGNVWAVQFHPEKSQRLGLRLLRNFLNFCRDRA
jgi:glutamine amidotransferase